MLGWLPLLAFVALGVGIGLGAARPAMGARRWVVHATPPVLVGLTVLLVVLSPPCEDFLDGPCETNWVSEASWVSLGLTLLAVIAVLTRAVRGVTRSCRRSLEP